MPGTAVSASDFNAGFKELLPSTLRDTLHRYYPLTGEMLKIWKGRVPLSLAHLHISWQHSNCAVSHSDEGYVCTYLFPSKFPLWLHFW